MKQNSYNSFNLSFLQRVRIHNLHVFVSQLKVYTRVIVFRRRMLEWHVKDGLIVLFGSNVLIGTDYGRIISIVMYIYSWHLYVCCHDVK